MKTKTIFNMKRLARKMSQIFKGKDNGPLEVEANKARNRIKNDEIGLKLLYDGEQAIVDIIAVHGLNGHREKSWTALNGVAWLQSILPKDLPNSRIFTWGYETPASDVAFDVPVFQTVSEKLVQDLNDMREATVTVSRPIIFIAHSQGGTIVKSAILYSEQGKNGENGASTDLHDIAKSTHGNIFMGTPELDSRLSGLKSYISLIENSNQNQNQEFKEAQWILYILEKYSSISDRFKNYFAYERSPSKTSNQETQMASFQRLSPHIIIDRTHEEMVKYKSSTDDAYVKVKDVLLDMSSNIEGRQYKLNN
ncbi:hypothetical protein PENSTE_c026G03081 [Penicillium steckii]|uniref:DUF676 domain-containing protein n=1 Tax=Penicillium steckii TaxID=303698 RepID=A0A1V6SP88_9EURO|nr:hypothetical protein PENSTE_c026G03081 [Penicillium steckii]